jgi:hypothetical protein
MLLVHIVLSVGENYTQDRRGSFETSIQTLICSPCASREASRKFESSIYDLQEPLAEALASRWSAPLSSPECLGLGSFIG